MSDYILKINAAPDPPEINSEWNKKFWNGTDSLTLKNYIGDLPSHFPDTWLKLCYDTKYIYVIFKVNDRYIRAVETSINGRVWEDSCVEFFFTPGEDTERGYFNFEANCKGVYLFQYHLPDKKPGFVEPKDLKGVIISNSLDMDVSTELTEPHTWTLEYRIPFRLLSNYMAVDQPEEGVIWRANFYKCGDKTSHPHWLTWAPVDYPEPKFHLPEFFGYLQFK